MPSLKKMSCGKNRYRLTEQSFNFDAAQMVTLTVRGVLVMPFQASVDEAIHLEIPDPRHANTSHRFAIELPLLRKVRGPEGIQ